MEILCKCGHGIEYHKRDGCNFMIKKMWDGPDAYFPLRCHCGLSYDAVEAVYWWDFYQKETYKLREKLIARDECPDCRGTLLEKEIGLPDDTKAYIYQCCVCNKIWSYSGKEL